MLNLLAYLNNAISVKLSRIVGDKLPLKRYNIQTYDILTCLPTQNRFINVSSLVLNNESLI